MSPNVSYIVRQGLLSSGEFIYRSTKALLSPFPPIFSVKSFDVFPHEQPFVSTTWFPGSVIWAHLSLSLSTYKYRSYGCKILHHSFLGSLLTLSLASYPSRHLRDDGPSSKRTRRCRIWTSSAHPGSCHSEREPTTGFLFSASRVLVSWACLCCTSLRFHVCIGRVRSFRCNVVNAIGQYKFILMIAIVSKNFEHYCHSSAMVCRPAVFFNEGKQWDSVDCAYFLFMKNGWGEEFRCKYQPAAKEKEKQTKRIKINEFFSPLFSQIIHCFPLKTFLTTHWQKIFSLKFMSTWSCSFQWIVAWVKCQVSAIKICRLLGVGVLNFMDKCNIR